MARAAVRCCVVWCGEDGTVEDGTAEDGRMSPSRPEETRSGPPAGQVALGRLRPMAPLRHLRMAWSQKQQP